MLKYWLWLTERPGLTNQVRLALLRHFGTPEAVYYADPEELLLTEGMTAAQVQHLAERDLGEAENILEACDRLHQHILTIQDAAYPDRLKNIYDPPCLLYWQGHLPAFDEEAPLQWWGHGPTRPMALPALRSWAMVWLPAVLWWSAVWPGALTARLCGVRFVPENRQWA